ncbi:MULTISPECIES: hypothetical protein [Streptomyces]|nr:hypothetical protein [Streptomyces indiaensis]
MKRVLPLGLRAAAAAILEDSKDVLGSFSTDEAGYWRAAQRPW